MRGTVVVRCKISCECHVFCQSICTKPASNRDLSPFITLNLYVWYVIVVCNAEIVNICKKALFSWTVRSISHQTAVLSNCDPSKIKQGDELLFIVTRGVLDHFGKYDIMKVTGING